MSKCKKIIDTFIKEIIGVFLFALGIHIFIAFNNIVPGGTTGVATIINHILNIPIGAISLVLNIPLLIMGFYYLNKKSVIRTVFTVLELSIMLDYVVAPLPIYKGNMIISAIMGGILMGCGLGLILLSGTTTGGSDLLGKIIQAKHLQVPIGKILLTIDFIVITSSIFVFGKIKFALLGILTMATCCFIVDNMFMSNTNQVLTFENNKVEKQMNNERPVIKSQ